MCRRTATQFTKFAGTETELLFECLAECRMGIISSGKRNLGDIHRAHAQFSARAFHPQTADITGGAFTDLGGKNSVEVRHGKSRDFCQNFPVERLVDVFADVKLDVIMQSE